MIIPIPKPCSILEPRNARVVLAVTIATMPKVKKIEPLVRMRRSDFLSNNHPPRNDPAILAAPRAEPSKPAQHWRPDRSGIEITCYMPFIRRYLPKSLQARINAI